MKTGEYITLFDDGKFDYYVFRITGSKKGKKPQHVYIINWI